MFATPKQDPKVSRMRNIPVLFLGLALLAALAACGGGGGGGDPAVASVSIGSGPGSASVQWTGANDPRVTGYRVYVGTTSGSYLQARGAGLNAGAATASDISGLNAGQRYYFAVTSYDSAGNESAYSGEASKLIN